jgi:hypothetical protein
MGESSSGTVISDDAKWQRYGFLAGVVFVVLSLVAAFLPGSPPERDASSEDIAKYFIDNDSGIRLAATMLAFAMIFALWWIASMWRVTSRLEAKGPRLALVGLIAFISAGAFAGIGQVMFTVPALRGGDLLGTADFAWAFGFTTYAFALAFTAGQMLAFAILTLRAGFLPKWMGYLALVSSAVSAFGAISAGSEEAVFSMVGFVGYMTWLLWVLLSSVLLYRKTA